MNVDPSRVFVSWAVYYSDRGDFSSIFHAEVEHHGYWLILLCFPFVRSLSFSCGSETGWDGKHCFRQQNESIVNLQSIWRGWLVTSEHRNWWLANMKLCSFQIWSFVVFVFLSESVKLRLKHEIWSDWLGNILIVKIPCCVQNFSCPDGVLDQRLLSLMDGRDYWDGWKAPPFVLCMCATRCCDMRLCHC